MKKTVTILLSTLTLIVGGSLAARAQDVIRIGYQPLVAIPQGAMKQQGWFEEATGAEVEWRPFSSGGDVNTAFAAGAIDIGLVGLPVFVSGTAQGIDYRLFMLYDLPGTMSGLAVQGNSGIVDFDDLKGKRIGVPFGSGADYMLQGALKENGLSANDVTLVNLQPQPIVAAWSTGQIDGAYIWAPILTTLMEQDGQLLTNDGQMAEKGYFAGDVGVVSDAFAEAHPDYVQAWVEQNLRAVNWVNSGEQAALDAMMAEYELTPDQLEASALPPAITFPDRDAQLGAEWLGDDSSGLATTSAEVGNFLLENQLISNAPGIEDLKIRIDPEYLENAQVPELP